MRNNSRTVEACTPAPLERGRPSPSMETLCSDAMERIGRMLNVRVDLDDPEPAFIAAVEHRLAALIESAKDAGRSNHVADKSPPDVKPASSETMWKSQ